MTIAQGAQTAISMEGKVAVEGGGKVSSGPHRRRVIKEGAQFEYEISTIGAEKKGIETNLTSLNTQFGTDNCDRSRTFLFPSGHLQ